MVKRPDVIQIVDVVVSNYDNMAFLLGLLYKPNKKGIDASIARSQRQMRIDPKQLLLFHHSQLKALPRLATLHVRLRKYITGTDIGNYTIVFLTYLSTH